MSADIKTAIVINGSPEELEAMLKALSFFETEMYEQYKKKQRCAYIDKVRIWGSERKVYLNDLSDEKIRALVSKSENSLIIEAEGPYGYYSMLEEVGLFEYLAEAAPTAGFSGSSEGYITGAEVALNGELKNGLLNTSHYYREDEEEDMVEDDCWDSGKIYDPVMKEYL